MVKRIIKWLFITLTVVSLASGGYLANQRYERSKWYYANDEMRINPKLSMENLFSQDYSRIVVDSDGKYIKLFVVAFDRFFGRVSYNLLAVDLGDPRTEIIKVNGRWVKFNGFTNGNYLKPTTTEGAVYLLTELRKGRVELESEHGSFLEFDGSGVDEAYHRLNKRREAITNSL